MICNATATTMVQNTTIPFTMGTIVSEPRHANDLALVSWWLPGRSATVDFRKGRKKHVVDIYGPWKPLNSFRVDELEGTMMPDSLVPLRAVLLMNFELNRENEIPFRVFDQLRKVHGKDCTALSLSQTKNGNVYRNHVLMGMKCDGEE